MRKLTPADYLEEFHPGLSMTTRTVVNWIKTGKLAGEQLPNGRWVVIVEEALFSLQAANTSEQTKLMSMIMANKQDKGQAA